MTEEKKINGSIQLNFDIEEMKNRIIFGIPLYDTEGNPFPDDLLQSYLDSAKGWLEQQLDILIDPTDLVEEHDYLASDYMNWNYIKLWKKPIVDVHSLELMYCDSQVFNIPRDWMKIDHIGGTIQMFPTSGSAGGMIITSSGAAQVPLLQGRMGYAPQMWKVTYRAGMEGDKLPNGMPVVHPMLKDTLYRKAAMGILGVWGDLIIGAGIANQSIGIDGLSQSIGTTQSPMYGGASARIEQLGKDVDQAMPALRSYYSGIEFTVV